MEGLISLDLNNSSGKLLYWIFLDFCWLVWDFPWPRIEYFTSLWGSQGISSFSTRNPDLQLNGFRIKGFWKTHIRSIFIFLNAINKEWKYSKHTAQWKCWKYFWKLSTWKADFFSPLVFCSPLLFSFPHFLRSSLQIFFILYTSPSRICNIQMHTKM